VCSRSVVTKTDPSAAVSDPLSDEPQHGLDES